MLSSLGISARLIVLDRKSKLIANAYINLSSIFKLQKLSLISLDLDFSVLSEILQEFKNPVPLSGTGFFLNIITPLRS